MKKKTVKIIALVAALALIIGVGLFANSLVGNPISRMLATNTAEEYLAEKYSDKDFNIERVTYSFKDGDYHVFITAPGSIDSDFTLQLDMSGKLRLDSYEDRVLRGWNTANRLSGEYRALVDSVLRSPTFPFYSHIGYGDLEFIPREYANEESVSRYSLITEELELDRLYDVRELGKKAGHVVLYVYDEEVTVERAAEILLEVKNQMDAGSVPFYVIDFVLEYPKPEDDSYWREGRVETMEFAYDDIYEEGMVERVHDANEAAIAHHAAMDAENAKLLEELQGK